MPPIAPRPDPAAELWLEPMADALACPMLLLRHDGRLLHANAAARDLLAARLLLERDARGHVRPVGVRSRAAFAAALQAAAGGGRIWLSAARDGLAARLAAVAPSADRPPHVLLVLPATRSLALDDYAARHGLNEQEAALAAALLRGERLGDVAHRLRCSLGAVRHRAATLRRKTGHASLLGLVRELDRLPPLRC